MMTKFDKNMARHANDEQKQAFLDEAYAFYVSQGYATQTPPEVPGIEFLTKFTTAYDEYRKSGFHHDLTIGHMGGIDFNKDVTLSVIPKGQRQTQMQVAWGKKGNYYSTSDFTPEEIGIAPVGKKWNQSFGAPKPTNESLHDFPSLPANANPTTTPPPPILMTKRTITYEASQDVPCLKSSAKAITDTWSTGKPIDIKGGGMQLFVGDSHLMNKVDFGVHDKINSTENSSNASSNPSVNFKQRLQNQQSTNSAPPATASPQEPEPDDSLSSRTP